MLARHRVELIKLSKTFSSASACAMMSAL